ncbi:Uncharacterized protein FWK35_00015455 [Aphis craccivora]|uniref:Uncharacterized protein n=1 Tax=Aphis craccivora TaxID=307492 RepID=A0A6G0Y0R5_APHCR|nr:Uncharacterized protein FWK35_00015455 [Aphis craccivora]
MICACTNQTLKQKEQLFSDSMKDLFDIVHQDALNMISIIQDDKEIGRPGLMLDVDIRLTNIEKRKEMKRKENYLKNIITTAASTDEDSMESEPENMDESFEIDQ